MPPCKPARLRYRRCLLLGDAAWKLALDAATVRRYFAEDLALLDGSAAGELRAATGQLLRSHPL